MRKTSNYITVICVAAIMIASATVGYLIAPGEGEDQVDHNEYFQVSTYNRLAAGYYGGGITVEELLQHGDFGIGTIEGIDGEMIIVDGVAYRAGTDLKPEKVEAGAMVPFAMVCHYSYYFNDGSQEWDNYTEIKENLSSLADHPSTSIVCAVMIDMEFDSLTIRSVPGQEVPYPPLTEVIAQQTTLTLHNVSGKMVGFVVSENLNGVNVPGFHLHFISDDLSYGGHVLDFSAEDILLKCQPMTEITMCIVDHALMEN